jgi:hypothetical protein
MDNYGQIARNWADNSWQKDDYGRLWTVGSALQNRRLHICCMMVRCSPFMYSGSTTKCVA